MTIQEINKSYYRIIASLNDKELKSAFEHLQGLLSGSQQFAFQDKLEELQNTYKYMLRYRMEGVQDPMQEQIYNQTLLTCYELAALVRVKALEKESPRAYFNARRILRTQAESAFLEVCATIRESAARLQRKPLLEERRRMEEATSLLFRKLWVSTALPLADVEELRNLLHDETVSYATKSLLVSGLWLGLQETFDKEKVGLLFDAMSVDSNEVRTRALVSILLTLYFYRKRIMLYPQIEHRLQALNENYPGLAKDIQTIILRFILSRETEKISRKLQNEILPEMMKFSSSMKLSEFNPEQLSEDMNPEWHDKIMSNQDLSKKMTEFSDLQLEGADVMHSTFVHLKNYDFFREIANWFLPFDKTHSVFGETATGMANTMIDAAGISPFMCNSDKYSLFISMKDIPEEYRKAMTGQLDSQTLEMLQQKQGELQTRKEEVKIIAGQYIQDLYRFYKLYPAHLDFEDIFSYPLDFHNLPILQPYLSDAEGLTAIAEYYLQKNYFADALVIYRRLVEMEPENETLFQKIGYCHQMSEHIEEALQAYLQADLLNTNSKWVIRRIANCYRTLKQPKKALEYYRRYEQLDADNLSVQTSIGHCYLELHEYSEALKYYYKVDYLDTKSNRAWRPIAWCSFLTGKYDQARNYYKKIIEANPNMHDYLNAGHTEWALQNIKGAVSFYKQAVQAADNNFQDFREQFIKDIPDLEKAGIEAKEVPMFLDMLRYELDSSY